MTRRRGRRRRDERRKQAAIVVLAVIVGTVAGFVASPPASRHRPRANALAVKARVVPARTLLFGHARADRRVDLLTLIGMRAGGHQATVLFVPPPTVVQVPSLDLQRLGDVTKLANAKLLRISVMNALGVRVDDSLLVTDDQLGKLLAPAQKLDVTFSQGVRIDDRHGSLGYGAGVATLPAADVRRVLLGHEAEGTLSHFVTVQSVLESWFARLRDPVVAARTVASMPGAGRQLVAIARASSRFETLPVQTVDAGGAERFQLRDADVAALIQHDFPFARLGGATRPRVEILNGVGTVGVTPRVAALLVPKGANVLLTSNVPGFGVRTSHVVYYRDRDEPLAKYYAQLLGVGRVAKGDTPISVVDITIVAGSDFVHLHPK
jgi:hypothetical protein